MVSDSKTAISPTERLMRKRLAARLRQQRCRARKKELTIAKKQREQQEVKGAAHVPAQARRPIIVPRNHAVPTHTSHTFPRQSSHVRHSVPHHKPHLAHHHQRPHQAHRPHRPRQAPLPHHIHHHPRSHQNMHVSHPPPPPPPPPHHHHHRHHHRHHPSAHYSSHAIVPLFVTEPPVSRTHSIGSVVSFDDGSCPAAPKPFEGIPMPPLYVKPEKLFVKNNEDFELPVPTVSPSMAADKPIVEPDVAVLGSVPDRSPTKEETAIDAMLSLRSASFGV